MVLKRGGVSVAVEATVQRVVVPGSLEAQLFPSGLAVVFGGGRPSQDQFERLLRS